MGQRRRRIWEEKGEVAGSERRAGRKSDGEYGTEVRSKQAS